MELPMRTIRGDLLQLALDGEFDAIVHGCNCQCQMGKGIALSIKQRFPEAYAADIATVKGDRSKLGTISVAEIRREDRNFHVINGYTQFHWQGQGMKADYGAIRSVMKAVKAGFAGRSIGYPRIGAGLAGGDWATIASIIDEELADENHRLVEYTP
ncbi:phosphatase [Mesorhizobium erdmanii]|uniref:Phosphatase n=3 Tax=Phyllobacteriaceae TaxID=69277 RepID=A0A3M9X213_9HYPH|nr:phosphatase [Mesorhizobium japonicum]RXT43281.1 phosphatase [Mesorhizobium erdmanii]